MSPPNKGFEEKDWVEHRGLGEKSRLGFKKKGSERREDELKRYISISNQLTVGDGVQERGRIRINDY